MTRTNKGGGKSWRKDHDPLSRPLGCNGKYGGSGGMKHHREGTEICDDCRESAAHYMREKRRGGIKPRRVKPCGTPAAAQRHRGKGEATCFKCRVAEANDRAERYHKQKSKAAPTRAALVIKGDKQ